MHSTFGASKAYTVDDAPPDIKEFFRGDMWNDDPECQMFDDEEDDNWNFSSGTVWLSKFTAAQYGDFDEGNLIGRSHFWDLQFLHAMGAALGEQPDDTRAKIMLWLEVAYKLSVGGGGIDGADAIGDVPVTSVVNETTSYQLSDFFTATSSPRSTDSLSSLFACSTRYRHVDVQRRAIGSCLHLVQDSFARGHTRRVLLNPEDLVPSVSGNGTITEFAPGKYAVLGAVENFHSYVDQGSAHADADHWDSDWPDMDAAEPSSFDRLWGARVAQEKGVRLLDFWQAGTAWEDGVADWLLGEVFNLSPNATSSDNTV
ncbi:hypothetical protein SLS62_002373 [Diatrype stigma]|uniref:Uncharacterized protein n=1 Tax=Diatrype stigma TaxID=117547 RepID=A0AAN9UUT8_9PEZI